MDEWATRVTNHSTSAKMAMLTPTLEQADQHGSQDANALRPLARMRAIHEATLTGLGLAEPLLAPDQVPNAIASNTQARLGQPINYNGNADVGHIQSAFVEARVS